MPSEPPLILGFDTSAAQCAAALVSDGNILTRRDEAMNRGQAERLLPMLEEVLAEAGVTWQDLAAVAVCTGPGNFTGLRLSVAAARGLALGLAIPAIGVTRFEVLAHGTRGPALVTIAAPLERLHAQTMLDGVAASEPRLLAADEVSAPPGTLAIGDGAEGLAARLGLKAKPGSVPDPAVVARIAAGRLDCTVRPAPLYLREADAAPVSEPPPRIIEDPA